MQIWAYTTDPADKLVWISGVAALLAGTLLAIMIYMCCYNPHSTHIRISKSYGTLYVTYRMLWCGRSTTREEKLNDVADVVVKPIKTQYGITGYVLEIYFRSGAPRIQVHKDKSESVIKEFEELSTQLIGRNATGNDESLNDCSCRCDTCYCICCKLWCLVTLIFILAVLLYITVSMGIAYAVDEKFLE